METGAVLKQFMTRPTETTKPEELLRSEYVEIYQAQLHSLWNRLIRIRDSMHIVKSISGYPLAKLIGPLDARLWQVLNLNCGDSVVLLLFSLIGDSDRRNLSLLRFKNCLEGWLIPDYVEWYRAKLSEARFDSDFKQIKDRVVKLRQKHIAHLEWEPDGIHPAVTPPSISEEDVEHLYAGVKRLFLASCLTAESIIDMNDYRLKKEPHPIDRLLELVARESAFVRRPEKHGEWWSGLREHIGEVRIKELNYWREKLGLPPA